MPEQAVGAFAIRPCPEERVETFPWRGRALTLRPIRPDDGARHLEFLGRLEPIDIRMRVFYSRKSVEREMAFIATAPGPDGGEETLGVAWPRPTPTTSAPSSASSCART
jgi:acetyltransferase